MGLVLEAQGSTDLNLKYTALQKKSCGDHLGPTWSWTQMLMQVQEVGHLDNAEYFLSIYNCQSETSKYFIME